MELKICSVQYFEVMHHEKGYLLREAARISRLKGDVNNILCLTGSSTIGVATTCLDKLFRCRSQLNVDSIDLV